VEERRIGSLKVRTKIHGFVRAWGVDRGKGFGGERREKAWGEEGGEDQDAPIRRKRIVRKPMRNCGDFGDGAAVKDHNAKENSYLLVLKRKGTERVWGTRN